MSWPNPVFIDANILIYASGPPFQLREPCIRIMEAIGVGTLTAVADVEVVQEVVHFTHRRGELQRGLQIVSDLMDAAQEVYPYEKADARAMMNLLKHRPQLDGRDAVHAAIMLRHGITHIITADRDFSGIPGITALSPTDAATLLASERGDPTGSAASREE